MADEHCNSPSMSAELAACQHAELDTYTCAEACQHEESDAYTCQHTSKSPLSSSNFNLDILGCVRIDKVEEYWDRETGEGGI